MRWFVLLLLTACDGEVEEPGEDLEEPPSCESEESDVERVDEPAPSVAGVAIVERLQVESDTAVSIERGDVDTSPLPHCLPVPTCVEALLRDKPLSGPTHAVLLFDGVRLRTNLATDHPTGLSIAVTTCVGTSSQQLDFVDGTATLITSFPRATSPEPGAGTASRSP